MQISIQLLDESNKSSYSFLILKFVEEDELDDNTENTEDTEDTEDTEETEDT